MVHMVYDQFCELRPERCYMVRSIYLDTIRKLFYLEKMGGLKVRKKLRIRAYDQTAGDAGAYLEIKRKIGRAVLKERALIPLEDVPNIVNGADVRLVHPGSRPHRITLDRFLYLARRLRLEPDVLVTYQREAFHGVDDQSLRVTLDINVCSYPTTDIGDIFREADLRAINDSDFILEVKFNGQMPLWLREIIRDFRLRLQAISKYCEGLNVWAAVARLERTVV